MTTENIDKFLDDIVNATIYLSNELEVVKMKIKELEDKQCIKKK